MITSMAEADVDAVVGVHLRSFEGFFLSFLGPNFLRLYYESVVGYPGAAGYVCLKGGRVVGFVCGMVSPSRFYSYLLRTRWWRFALAALGAALGRPSVIPRLFRALLYPSQTSGRSDTATLTSIAVDPAVQGEGVGAELVAAFLADMRARGVKRVDLTTDHYGNDEVNTFYQKQGFHCERTFVTPEGREMNEYVIWLQ
jgi:ribosomal protein S18 acetylase RimI-like enzyme